MRNKYFSSHQLERTHQQQGQALVLIAAALVGLLAFVGIAVDVGFVFARNTQLQAAVDAAALAGVTELTSDNINKADDRAERFLFTNDIPITDTATMESFTYTTEDGETAYGLTVTWPVELFFLRIIGWEEVELHKSATAAFYPYADIQTSRTVEYGTVNITNLAVSGLSAPTSCGDPYHTYYYRIQIPQSYYEYTDEVRVEIFDPDTYNANTNGNVAINRTTYATGKNNLTATDNTRSCSNNSSFPGANNRENICAINTGEETLVTTTSTDTSEGVTVDQVNPLWFVRVDKNRPPGGVCTGAGYSDAYSGSTFYQLFYYRGRSDGTVERVNIVSYTGLGDNTQNTDLRWVSPGAANYDDSGNPLTIPANDFTPTHDGFEITFDDDTPEIQVTQNCLGTDDCIYLYLEVKGQSGASVNGFDLWAGPATNVSSYPSNVNKRNLAILNAINSGGSVNHKSNDVVIYGVGALPLNWNTNHPYEIPFTYLNPNYTGVSVYIRAFDIDKQSDVGQALTPPFFFFFDTLWFDPSIPEGDWFMKFDDSGTDSDGVAASARCLDDADLCENEWTNPSLEIIVPDDDEEHFVGGTLSLYYDGGAGDTITWEANIAGAPYLLK